MKKIIYALMLTFIFASCSNDADDKLIVQCKTPTNIQFSDITFENTTVTWEDSNVTVTYYLEYGISGFELGLGQTLETTETSATLIGLEANTSYDVYIQSVCIDNNSMLTDVATFTTTSPLVVPQFLNNLSDLHLFSGDLTNLTPSDRAFIYNLNTPLFTDYAHKQRIIALPPGTTMEHVNDGLPNFPDNTVIAKTFYYFNNERVESEGKILVETRVLIKQNGLWELGNYKWNSDQSDAVLDNTTSTVPISYLDDNGTTVNVDYVIPSAQQCIECHNSNNTIIPIGPKLRSLNGNNQLENWISNNYISNLSDASQISILPNWEDAATYSLEQRARAYFDMNCAHCHSEGGFCGEESYLRLNYEIPLADSYIIEDKLNIDTRMSFYYPGVSMPLIGTTMVHPEGYDLISEYLDTL